MNASVIIPTIIWLLASGVVSVLVAIDLVRIRADRHYLEAVGSNGAMRSVIRRDTRVISGRLFQSLSYTLLGALILAVPGTLSVRIVFTVALLGSLAVVWFNTLADRINRRDIARSEGKDPSILTSTGPKASSHSTLLGD